MLLHPSQHPHYQIQLHQHMILILYLPKMNSLKLVFDKETHQLQIEPMNQQNRQYILHHTLINMLNFQQQKEATNSIQYIAEYYQYIQLKDQLIQLLDDHEQKKIQYTIIDENMEQLALMIHLYHVPSKSSKKKKKFFGRIIIKKNLLDILFIDQQIHKIHSLSTQKQIDYLKHLLMELFQ